MNKTKIILAGIFLLAIFFRFWDLSSLDVQHDVALNAVRALGWFDFLAGEAQTSPIIWFGSVPSWGFLSFHDHPPLVYLIQSLFLNIFGQSSFVVFLPYALFGVVSAFLIYYLLKKFKGEKEGLLGAFVFSISALSVWVTRMGYMEGVQILFILLSFYFFLAYLSDSKTKNIFLWALFVGLALISKYTAIFLLPASFIYLLIWEREKFKDKNLWLSLCIIIIVLSPVIFYNIMVFKTRGHFDAAFSSMIGMHPEDYSVLNRSVNTDLADNFSSIFISLKTFSSWGFFVVVIFSVFYLAIEAIKKRANALQKFLLINIFFIVLMFSFAGVTPRFISIIIPFLSISLSLFVFRLFELIKSKKVLIRTFIFFLVFIFGWETVYAFNTNVARIPFSKNEYFYSGFKPRNTSFNKLDNYLKENAYGELPEKKKIKKLEDVLNYNLLGREAILFDDRIDWNLSMWYVHRYQAYYDVPIVYISDALSAAKDENIFSYLIKAGAKGFWLVKAEGEEARIKDTSEYRNFINALSGELEKAGIKPEKEIFNDYGEKVFTIYRFYLN